jgi:hypothetical protein
MHDPIDDADRAERLARARRAAAEASEPADQDASFKKDFALSSMIRKVRRSVGSFWERDREDRERWHTQAERLALMAPTKSAPSVKPEPVRRRGFILTWLKRSVASGQQA